MIMRYASLLVCFLLVGCFSARVPSLDDSTRSAQLLEKGVLHLRAGNFDAAEASFQLVHEILPQAAALDGLGCVAFARGELDRAENLFHSALTVDPDYYEAYGHLADVYESKGRFQDAGEYYQIAKEQKPQDFRIRNNFAVHLIERGKGERTHLRGLAELRRSSMLTEHPLVQKNRQIVESYSERE
jgi:Tfp pilus assembly protein PilF